MLASGSNVNAGITDLPALKQAFAPCGARLVTNTFYQCVPELGNHNASYQFSLVDAPEGMAIQARTGVIKWTPLNYQARNSSWRVTVLNNHQSVGEIELFVKASNIEDPAGVYVSTLGDDSLADGSPEAPFATLTAAAKFTKRHNLPLQIYLRGGEYQDLGAYRGSMLRIQDRHGTPENWNFIRPLGNEYARIKSTRDVISVARSSYLAIENLELDGMASGVTVDDVMPYWWADGRAMNPYKNKGLSANSSEHIRYSGNIIHDFSGGAISNNYSEFITIENNIIYRNAWWSTSGTHGISNSKTGNKNSRLTPNELKYVISGNLVFANASLIPSHVFSKGFVTLAVDEGNGIHLQNNHGTYFGHASVTGNLAIFNGKAGLGINTMDKVQVSNNSFYHNGNVLRDLGGQGGEIRLQSTTLEKMQQNLLHSLSDNPAIKDSQSRYGDVTSNAVNVSAENTGLRNGFSLYNDIFKDPDALDFSPGLAANKELGVPQVELERMFARVKEYGIDITPIPQTLTPGNLQDMQRFIFETWPSNGSIEGSDVDYQSLVLKVKVANRQGKLKEVEYNYAQRCQFPNPPSSQACD